jgi:DNA mismatch repair protein PMS2
VTSKVRLALPSHPAETINGILLPFPPISIQLIRAINEVYHTFNPNQSPFVVLDMKMPRDSIDVNVSPDKREIFLHSELDLIEALRVS